MKPPLYCRTCGTVGAPKQRVKGSFLLELLLWIGLLVLGLISTLWLLVPAIVYSIWRLTTKALVCSACGSEAIIPVDSPVAVAARAAALEVKP